MNIKFFILVFFFLASLRSYSQVKLDCQNYFKEDEIDYAIYDSFENPPVPINGYKSFYEEIRRKTKESIKEGKVYVQFIVDTLGSVHCSRIVKSDNEALNKIATKLIEGAVFTPANQQGRKIVSIMVLPITFGKGRRNKERKCKD